MEALDLNTGGVGQFLGKPQAAEDDPIVSVRLSAWVKLAQSVEELQHNQHTLALGLEKLIQTYKADVEARLKKGP